MVLERQLEHKNQDQCNFDLLKNYYDKLDWVVIEPMVQKALKVILVGNISLYQQISAFKG